MTAYREGELFREAWQSVLNSVREEGKVDSPDARKSDREDYRSPQALPITDTEVVPSIRTNFFVFEGIKN
jgi:hypothetical protein